jgi:hypothetical protein
MRTLCRPDLSSFENKLSMCLIIFTGLFQAFVDQWAQKCNSGTAKVGPNLPKAS